jgi:hypothetical protein
MMKKETDVMIDTKITTTTGKMLHTVVLVL